MNKRKPSRSLADFVQGHDTQNDAAASLGISPTYLSMLLSGQRLPGRKLMFRLADRGISIDSWRKGAAA